MSPEDFLAYWRQTYGETPLVGHVLRDCFPRRWLRIHNLPGSKRYAETDAEHQEILRRQNELFDDLLGEGGRGELVFGYYGEEDHLPEEVLVSLRGLDPVLLMMLSMGESGLVQEYPLLKASFTWKQQALDPILLAVADDILETPIIVSAERCRTLAPYDGGVDMILESEELRDRLRVRYASWLSKHPAGL